MNGEEVCELNLDIISKLSSEHSIASMKTLHDCAGTSKEDGNDNKEDENDDIEEDGKKLVKKDSLDRLECQLCGKSFSTKFNLGVHEGKLKHFCESCDAKFCSKSALSVRMKKEHGREKFSCNDCGKEFDVKCNFERHLKVKTKMNCLMCNFSFYNS